MAKKPNESKNLRPRNILAAFVTIATLAPIISFLSSTLTPYLKNLLMVGPEQSFSLCNIQSNCENSNQRFERFLAKHFNKKVTLDITYTVGTSSWDSCIDPATSSDPHEQICNDFRNSDYISYDDCLELTPSDLEVRAIPQGIVERLTQLWAAETEKSPFFDIPLFGNGQCMMGSIARFDSELAIMNAAPGTGIMIYRIFGDYLIGGGNYIYFLTKIR